MTNVTKERLKPTKFYSRLFSLYKALAIIATTLSFLGLHLFFFYSPSAGIQLYHQFIPMAVHKIVLLHILFEQKEEEKGTEFIY